MTDEQAEAFMAEWWRHTGGIQWRSPLARLGWFGLREQARDAVLEAIRQGIVVPATAHAEVHALRARALAALAAPCPHIGGGPCHTCRDERFGDVVDALLAGVGA